MVGLVRNGLTSARKVGARNAIESPFEIRDPISEIAGCNHVEWNTRLVYLKVMSYQTRKLVVDASDL